MSWWQGVVLGIIQGLTEFLPISSSGHLVVAQAAVGLESPGVQIEVVLHVATLLAVIIVYRTTLLSIVKGLFARDPQSWKYAVLLGLATVPAGLVGVLLADALERVFDSLLAVGINFVLTGAILWSTRRVPEPSSDRPGWWQAVTIGASQALAILPGISRSGTTVAAAMWLKIRPVAAAEFSFLLAIPAVSGAAVLLLSDVQGGGMPAWDTGLIISFVCALISGIAAIQLLILLLRKRAFHRFAPYCWVLGVATIAWSLFSS